jgi:hypothetical protein
MPECLNFVWWPLYSIHQPPVIHLVTSIGECGHQPLDLWILMVFLHGMRSGPAQCEHYREERWTAGGRLVWVTRVGSYTDNLAKKGWKPYPCPVHWEVTSQPNLWLIRCLQWWWGCSCFLNWWVTLALCSLNHNQILLFRVAGMRGVCHRTQPWVELWTSQTLLLRLALNHDHPAARITGVSHNAWLVQLIIILQYYIIC